MGKIRVSIKHPTETLSDKAVQGLTKVKPEMLMKLWNNVTNKYHKGLVGFATRVDEISFQVTTIVGTFKIYEDELIETF